MREKEDITKIYMHGFTVYIHIETGYQDIDVISDCLGGDCYGLEELAHKLTPEVVLDIGGHIGAFGLYAKKLWPECKLIAIEPYIGSCELYRKNLEVNGFEGTVIQKAINYNPARTQLVHAARTSGGHVVVSESEAKEYIDNQYRQFEYSDAVESITLEDLLADINVVDLAKWDCEGAEQEAFRKMSDNATAKFRTMVGEYHLWGDGKRILQASPLDEELFWMMTKRKFPHLLWSWTGTAGGEDKYGKFQAWPKSH